MTDTNRRDALKLGAGAVLAVGGATGRGASAHEPMPPSDPQIAAAKLSRSGMMLSDPLTFDLGGVGAGRELIITTAVDENGKPIRVSVRSRSVCVFRADAGVFSWRLGDKSGDVKLPKVLTSKAGPIVMVVREGFDTVRCYAMSIDFRC